MEVKRILQITATMDVGGIEMLLMNIYRGIDREQFEFNFLEYTSRKCHFDDEIEQLGGKIFKLNEGRKYFFYRIRKFIRILKNGKYDVVHMHTGGVSGTIIINSILCKIFGVKKVILHSHSYEQREKSFMHKVGQKVFGIFIDQFISCSKEAAFWLFGEKNVKKRNVIYIKNGVYTNKYIYNEQTRNNLRDEYGLTNNLVLGNVGRLQPEKNHEYALEVFREVNKQITNSKLLLIGKGNQLDNLKKIAKKYNIEDKVLFMGNRDDVNLMLQMMDIFLFPSKYEGLPIALIEAQTAGLTCFASDTIPRESDITNTIKFRNIKDNPKIWADEIVAISKNLKRLDNIEKVKESGFDISEAIKNIQNIYRNA